MGCLQSEDGTVHLCVPTPEKTKTGPTCVVVPQLRGDVIKTTCCHQVTLARETNCVRKTYDYYETDWLFYCKPGRGHCGGKKSYNLSWGF